jgi:hypothetical protein
MFKNTILQKGLIKAPAELEARVMQYAVNQIEIEPENNDEWYNYINWLPFSILLFIIKNLVEGKRLSFQPSMWL